MSGLRGVPAVQTLPALPFKYTISRDLTGATLEEHTTTFSQFGEIICIYPPCAATKSELPLFSPTTFGDKPSKKGSFRRDNNVTAVFGISCDYDAEKMSVHTAAQKLRSAGIVGVLYTTGSHTADKPRWRFVAPLSIPITGTSKELRTAYVKYVARVNGVLGGVLANESFKLSQSYYFGRVTGREYETEVTDGHYIDLLDHLQESSTPPPKQDTPNEEWLDNLSSDNDDARLRKFLAATTKAESNELAARVFNPNHVPKTIPTNRDLFEFNIDVLSEWKPSNDSEGDGVDHSTADFTLASRLAPFCEFDHGCIKRLMSRSGLSRNRWRDEPEWLHEKCIRPAVGNRKPRTFEKPDTPEVLVEYIVEGKGFIYISELDKVRCPDGRLYGQVQFDNEFSNRKFYSKHIGRKTKHSAWDYYVRDPDYGRSEVFGLRFRPDLSPLTIYVDPSDGRTYLNYFKPAPVQSVAGDVSPLLNHIICLFPNRDDAEIVLAFMAHAVQFPGVKPTWAITLIGAQGNGKSLLFDVIAEAVGRQYSYKPRACELDSKFNAYAEHNLILCIEEVRLRWKPELLDVLKPLISDGWIEIQGKGRDQITARNFSHVMLCSNHLDAVNKNTGDRRFCVLVTKQKTPDDINRDGMGGDYFKNLWHWLESEGGYAICAHFLKSYKIPDSLDFKGRAPITSTTAAAIEASLSDAATTLRDAVESVDGFCGGFIETGAATTRLQNKGLWGGPRKLAETLDALEYHRHPRLSGGDGRLRRGKERLTLYVKRGSPAEQLHTHNDIRNAFAQANPKYTAGGFVRSVK